MRKLISFVLALCLLCAAAAAEAAQKGSKADPYRLGERCAFTAEVLADGSPRMSADQEGFQSIEFEITLENYLTNAYFQENYGHLYKFDGTQAGAQLSFSNHATITVNPQNAFWLTVETEDGAQSTGYLLLDEPVSTEYGATVAPGETRTLYKRFAAPAEGQQAYLVLSYCAGGETYHRYFLLESRAVYDELACGSRGDGVVKMQEKLIALGYLNDDADGIFGGNTESAVRAARAAGGFDDSGTADDAFLFALYAGLIPSAQAGQ